MCGDDEQMIDMCGVSYARFLVSNFVLFIFNLVIESEIVHTNNLGTIKQHFLHVITTNGVGGQKVLWITPI